MNLIEKLREALGEANVLTGADAAGFGREWTGHYHWTPLAVVRPGSTAEVARTVSLARAAGVAMVPVGGNTGVAGGTHAEGALMISLARMNRIRELRPGARIVVAEAGVILSSLHEAAEAHGLAFPLTFGAKGSAMVGGFLSTNAGGSNVVRYGNTRALVLGIEVVLADGRVLNLMNALHKDNSGYDLRDLFIGAEGTLGIITAAVLKLVPRPRAYATATVAVPTLAAALGLLNTLQTASGGAVEAFEVMPEGFLSRLAAARPDLPAPFPDSHPLSLLIEIAATGPRDAAPGPDGSLPLDALLETVLTEAAETGAVADAVLARNEAQRRAMWARREAAAEGLLNTDQMVDTDIALPLDRIEAFLDAIRARVETMDPAATEAYVAHLGDGNLHYTLYPSRADLELYAALRAAVSEECVALGGSFSAEHGIGLSKRATMADHKDPVALDVMRAIKAALDPEGRLNPGKVLP